LVEELEAKPVDTTLFKQFVGSLRFICNSRPDISYGVGLISKFMHNPRSQYMTATKHILRYLKGTSDFGLLLPKGDEQSEAVHEAFSDLDWCGDEVERNSTFEYLFKYLNAPISCNVAALLSYEAEYIAPAEATSQSLWLESMLE